MSLNTINKKIITIVITIIMGTYTTNFNAATPQQEAITLLRQAQQIVAQAPEEHPQKQTLTSIACAIGRIIEHGGITKSLIESRDPAILVTQPIAKVIGTSVSACFHAFNSRVAQQYPKPEIPHHEAGHCFMGHLNTFTRDIGQLLDQNSDAEEVRMIGNILANYTENLSFRELDDDTIAQIIEVYANQIARVLPHLDASTLPLLLATNMLFHCCAGRAAQWTLCGHA